MSYVPKPLNKITNDITLINVQTGEKCSLNACLKKFQPDTEIRRVIVPLNRGAQRTFFGSPMIEIEYEYVQRKCPCGHVFMAHQDKKENHNRLFGLRDKLSELVSRGELTIDDFNEQTREDGFVYYTMGERAKRVRL